MNTLLVFLLALTTLVVVVDIFLLSMVYKSAMRYKKYPSERTLLSKLKRVDWFLSMMVVTVLLVEGMVVMKYGFGEGSRLLDSHLGWVHAIADAVFFFSAVLMRFIVTGKKAPQAHVVLFKFLLSSFIVLVPTGVWLAILMIS